MEKPYILWIDLHVLCIGKMCFPCMYIVWQGGNKKYAFFQKYLAFVCLYWENDTGIFVFEILERSMKTTLSTSDSHFTQRCNWTRLRMELFKWFLFKAKNNNFHYSVSIRAFKAISNHGGDRVICKARITVSFTRGNIGYLMVWACYVLVNSWRSAQGWMLLKSMR